jgi:hypothetical protein
LRSATVVSSPVLIVPRIGIFGESDKRWRESPLRAPPNDELRFRGRGVRHPPGSRQLARLGLRGPCQDRQGPGASEPVDDRAGAFPPRGTLCLRIDRVDRRRHVDRLEASHGVEKCRRRRQSETRQPGLLPAADAVYRPLSAMLGALGDRRRGGQTRRPVKAQAPPSNRSPGSVSVRQGWEETVRRVQSPPGLFDRGSPADGRKGSHSPEGPASRGVGGSADDRGTCESGGIGRRAGLRIQSRKGYRFKSGLSHLLDMKGLTAIQR